MGYNTDLAKWPSFEINGAVKALIDRFFSLLDQQDPNVGNILADEIFGQNGKAEFGGHFFTGPEEIRKSRENAWKLVNSRRHKVLRVYSANLDGDDLLFIGQFEMAFHNGKSVTGEFTGRLVVEGAKSASPKLLLYQVWGTRHL